MKYMFRAKRTGVCLAAWHRLNDDPRYELVEVDAKGVVTKSRYIRVDEQGRPMGAPQPVKGTLAPKKATRKRAAEKAPAPPPVAVGGLGVTDADLDDLVGGI